MKNSTIRPFASAAAFLLALSAPALANQSALNSAPQGQSAGTASSHAQVSKSDAQILGKLHQINQEEVAAAKLAKDKSSSDPIKSYADELIRDHQNADSKVMDLAKKMNLDEASLMVPADKKAQKE